MSKVLDLLIHPLKLNGEKLFPSQVAKLENLTGDDFVVSNLTNYDFFNNGYQADLKTSDGFVIANAQKWNSANVIGLKNVVNNGIANETITGIYDKPYGTVAYIDNNAGKTLFLSLADTSTDEAILAGLQTALGIDLIAGTDFTLSRPFTNDSSFVLATFKPPYLIGVANVFVGNPTAANSTKLPNTNMGIIKYAIANPTATITPMTCIEILAWNLYYNTWNSTVTLDQMKDYLSTMATDKTYLFNQKYVSFQGGNNNNYYNCSNGMFDLTKQFGWDYVTYRTNFIEDSDWFNWTVLNSRADLPNVTTPGYYFIPTENIFKLWLVVEPNSGPIKDALAANEQKVKFTTDDYRFSISGAGDNGIPNPNFGYRGSYTFNNSLMTNVTLYIRWMGE